MSKEVDKATVFRTTQVRTKLKGDNSWLQRRNEPEAEPKEEKPWLAEVRAGRLNGAPIETSPVSSPTQSAPPPTKSDSERAPTSGYLIRGVWTKLDKPASSSTTNGYSGSTQFTKKPSESYRKIAPHTVKSTSENQEGQLSKEEQEKRTEAASGVLRKSAARQRSYVLSAAKKFESPEPQDPSLVNSSVSFVAKRVEITDDDESASTPAPASSPPPSPVVPVTSVASVPQPKPRKTADTSVKKAADVPVNEPVAPKVVEKEKPALEPVKEDPPPVSVVEKDPFEQMKPGCTKVDTPLPVLLPEFVHAVCTKPEPEDSDVSAQDDKPLVELAPAIPTPASPTPASPAPASAVPESPLPVPLTPLSPAPVSPVPVSLTPLSPTPVSPVPVSLTPLSPAPVSPVPVSLTPLSPAPVSPVPVSAVREITVKTEPESEPEPEPEPSPKPSSSVDTLTALSDTLISFGTSSTSFKDDEPVLAEEEGGSADSRTTENGVEQEPTPELSNCEPMTDNLLALSDGPEASAVEPVPPSPGRWSQDLLSGLDSEPSPVKTSSTLDLLANDDIVISTQARSLSMQREEEKQTDETAKETQSPTETVTITTKTVIITDKSEESNADPWSSHVTTTVTESSSADPFDPYPIGTTSPNSSSDLLQPLSDISINRVSTTSTENKDPSPETTMSSNALESLADDIIPINTDTTRLSSLSTQRTWTRSWETSTPQQTNTEESQDVEPEGQAADQETLIMFERKSKENDSPWDRWTSPTVYTITSTTGEEEDEDEEEEEEEEEESPGDTQTQTVTTITTIRETRSEQEPAMDHGSDYSTSSTTRYSYSGPSTRSSYETYSRTVTEEDQRAQTPESEAKKGFVFVKEYVDTTQLSLHNAKDTIDGGSDYLTSSSNRYLYSSPSTYTSGSLSSTCTYCGELVGNDAKISIEHLNINCHPACFKCAECSKPMGDLLDSMFLHGGKVNCESCYSKAF